MCTEKLMKPHFWQMCHISLVLLTTTNPAPLQSVHHLSPPPQILSVRSSTPHLSQTPPASQTFTFFKTVAELLHGWLSSHPHLPARQASSHGVADPTRLPLLISHPVDMGPPAKLTPKLAELTLPPLLCWRDQHVSLSCTQANGSHGSCRDLKSQAPSYFCPPSAAPTPPDLVSISRKV